MGQNQGTGVNRSSCSSITTTPFSALALLHYEIDAVIKHMEQ